MQRVEAAFLNQVRPGDHSPSHRLDGCGRAGFSPMPETQPHARDLHHVVNPRVIYFSSPLQTSRLTFTSALNRVYFTILLARCRAFVSRFYVLPASIHHFFPALYGRESNRPSPRLDLFSQWPWNNRHSLEQRHHAFSLQLVCPIPQRLPTKFQRLQESMAKAYRGPRVLHWT